MSDPQAKVSAWGPDGGSKPSDQETFVSELVVDGLGAYWAKSDGTIYGQSTGAKEPRLLAHLHDRVTGLALGKTRLFATYMEDSGEAGALVAIARSGGAPTLLSKLVNPTALAVDDTSAYVAAKEDVFAVSLANGERRALAHLAVSSLALDATNVFMTTASTIARVPKKGGRPFELADSLQDSPRDILVVADRLYFLTDDPQASSSALCSIPKSGRPKLPPDSSYGNGGTGKMTWGRAFNAASDGAAIFWTTASEDAEESDVKLLRQAPDSRSTTQIAHKLPDPTVAVFGSRVYWVTPSGIESIDKARSGPVVVDSNANP